MRDRELSDEDEEGFEKEVVGSQRKNGQSPPPQRAATVDVAAGSIGGAATAHSRSR